MASETVFYNNKRLVGIGSVGIGTTSPGVTLDVTGTVRASTQFSGPGTGLTGTASSLTVGAATNATNLSGGSVSATSGYFSGSVGIGPAPPGNTLDVAGNAKISGSSNKARLVLGPAPSTTNLDYCSLIESEYNTASNYYSQLKFYTHNTPTTASDPTFAMIIDYKQDVGIGTINPTNWFGQVCKLTAYGSSGDGSAFHVDSGGMGGGDTITMTKRYTSNYVIRMDVTPSTYNALFIYFATNGGASNPGTIQATNSTTMVYGSSSDYRIKSNIVPLSNSIEFITKLRPVNFTFNENPTEVVGGFIAHEIQELIPHAVTGVKDDVDENGKMRIQNLDVSFVVPYLTAAVKDLAAKNTDLEQSLATATATIGSLSTQLQTAQNDIDLLESRLAAIEALISTNTSADTTTSSTGTRADSLLAEAGAV